jgi:hypothetical protein
MLGHVFSEAATGGVVLIGRARCVNLFSISWDTRRRRFLLSELAAEAECAPARANHVGQARRWCSLSELSLLKQSKLMR